MDHPSPAPLTLITLKKKTHLQKVMRIRMETGLGSHPQETTRSLSARHKKKQRVTEHIISAAKKKKEVKRYDLPPQSLRTRSQNYQEDLRLERHRHRLTASHPQALAQLD
jgi:hypothetical protein